MVGAGGCTVGFLTSVAGFWLGVAGFWLPGGGLTLTLLSRLLLSRISSSLVNRAFLFSTVLPMDAGGFCGAETLFGLLALLLTATLSGSFLGLSSLDKALDISFSRLPLSGLSKLPVLLSESEALLSGPSCDLFLSEAGDEDLPSLAPC